MGALVVTYAGWTTPPRGESTQPDLAGMGLTSSVGPLLTTATLPQARQATHPPSGVPRSTISEAAAVWFRAFTTDIAMKYYTTNQSNSQNAEALRSDRSRERRGPAVNRGIPYKRQEAPKGLLDLADATPVRRRNHT
jgi:hypothetical protein